MIKRDKSRYNSISHKSVFDRIYLFIIIFERTSLRGDLMSLTPRAWPLKCGRGVTFLKINASFKDAHLANDIPVDTKDAADNRSRELQSRQFYKCKKTCY